MSIVARGLGSPGVPLAAGGLGILVTGSAVRVFPQSVVVGTQSLQPTLSADIAIGATSLIVEGFVLGANPSSAGAGATVGPITLLFSASIFSAHLIAGELFSGVEVVVGGSMGRPSVTIGVGSADRVRYTRIGSGADRQG